MSTYIKISASKKLKLLNEHSVGTTWKSLDDSKWCLHCQATFTGHSVRVYRENGEMWLECGTPGCDGSPIDWADYPWWDGKHPETKARDKAVKKLAKITKSNLPERN